MAMTLAIIGWVVMSVWAHRHVLRWMDWEDSFLDNCDGPDKAMGILLAIMVLILLGAGLWVPVFAWVLLKAVWDLLSPLLPGGGMRWLRWLYAIGREERKAALRRD
jgi:hypothetical protein